MLMALFLKFKYLVSVLVNNLYVIIRQNGVFIERLILNL